MSSEPTSIRGTVLVTGATGYIGGRLVPRLLERGWRVRCLVRSPRKLENRPWSGNAGVELVQADASNVEAVEDAMQGCSAAYYLIHSMESAGSDYRERDRTLARNFATAASNAGLEQIVYLGGLGETGEDLSEHLTSRRETEHALQEGDVPVTVLRAAMIIGSGSASFELLRYLVERLPIMITPRWVKTECQPIAIRNVLHYLTACLETPETRGKTLDIGGPDIASYKELMRVMAAERGLPKRIILPVPVLTPKLSSLWIHLVTPVSARLARPLAEGLRNRVVCRDDEAARLMPQHLLGVAESIRAALGKIASGDVETSWAGAGTMPGDPDWAGGTLFVDRREIDVDAPVEATYATVAGIGGRRGYYHADWLWRVRGALDQLAGGPGLRRGRRDPDRVRFGDAIDFWRVTGVEAGKLLELRAEMKLPGVATLSFTVEPREGGRSHLVQTARFKPKGLLGLMYWYSVLPMHHVVFQGMLRRIGRAAERRHKRAAAVAPASN